MVNSLKFEVYTDDRLILRVVPMVDGEPLSARFPSDAKTYGPAGLAMGVINCVEWPATDSHGHLRLLSCGCGAYDARVVAEVLEDEYTVNWLQVIDSLTGHNAGEFAFDAEAYHSAIARVQHQLKRRRWLYAMRILWNIREESLPFGLVLGPTDALLSLLLVVCAFLLPGGHLWVYPLFLSILFWSVLAWTRFTPWLHFPEDTRGCMYHFSGIYLRDNWWHTEWTMTDRGLGEALR